MKPFAVAAAAFLLCGCGRYADFTLPPLRGPAAAVAPQWDVRPEPVLRNGARGEWDGVDALNPSVLLRPPGYWNFYSGYDGTTWHTGLARSADGIAWEKIGRVFSPDPQTWEGDYIAANGSVVEVDGEFWHYYQGARLPKIGLARSSDGTNWNRHGAPVLPPGPRGSWDERGVADPYIVRFGGTFYMYYLGQDRARRQRLGLARSDDGMVWEKLRSNPVLELGEPGAFDETGLGEPAVWQAHGSYWMLYTARDPAEVRRLGLARSQDGVHWARVGSGPTLTGAEPWNSKVVCDPSVVVAGDIARVWFGGGNRAEPAENLDGHIGFATLTLKRGQ